MKKLGPRPRSKQKVVLYLTPMSEATIFFDPTKYSTNINTEIGRKTLKPRLKPHPRFLLKFKKEHDKRRLFFL